MSTTATERVTGLDGATRQASSGDVKRIVVLGGGFAGVYTARHLESRFRHDPSVRITLVSKVNYFLMTPLLFEAGSGILEPRHAVNPIRPLLERTRFVQAEVRGIDLARRVVEASPGRGEKYEIPYDHLVLALGGVGNRIVPGSEYGRSFKTLADAIALRNHVIQLFERADVEQDPERKRTLLTFVIIGGGLVGVELMGELTEFVFAVADLYPHVRRDEVRFELIEGAPHLVPELEPDLGDYAERVFVKRGVRVRLNTKVNSIDPGRVNLPPPSSPIRGDAAGRDGKVGELIPAETIIVSTGVLPNPLVASLPLDRDKKGRVKVHPTMRSTSHPEVWALGDCASIPDPKDPQGRPYPPLAQHALREAKRVARNIEAVIRGGEPQPFVYKSKGTLAALGHFKGVGRVYNIKIYGFVAWWVWRTYYLMQMPQWSRRLRIVIDWTIALFFKNDVVELDLAPWLSPADRRPNSDAPKPGAATTGSADGGEIKTEWLAPPRDGNEEPVPARSARA
jgi:NADH:ubiquinone reductase (H+-translocating)